MKFFSNVTQDRTLMLLAPADANLQPFSGRITRSTQLHSELITAMQRLRGRAYLDDGAIADCQLSDGRHISAADQSSWHLLIMGRSANVLGCTRFRQHPSSVSAEDLTISRAPIARCGEWGEKFRASLQGELDSARKAGFSYVEVGGWALDREVRGTTEALKSVLATYALGQIQGGAVAISTATRRNGSADILRRLGGQPLNWHGTQIPAYYDESYGCSMEVLRFDSRYPNPRYSPMIGETRSLMTRMPVICPREARTKEAWETYPANASHGFSLLPGLFGVPAVAA